MTPILTRRTAPNRTLERLYRHHARDVYRTALALLRNPEEAEDATQTAFLNAYRALMRGEKPREPRSWMLAIVHNVVRMRHRTLSRRPSEVPLEEGHEPATADAPVDLEPVLEALSRLPLNQRAAIVMREVEGRTYAEIASVLGVTVSSVEALIFRARRNLRMNREALGVLTLAPLPASLVAASGAGVGGIVAVAGSDAALKAVAVIVAGVVVGGAAIRAGDHAAAGNDRRSGPAPYRQTVVASPSAAFQRHEVSLVRTAARKRVVAAHGSAPARRSAPTVVITAIPAAVVERRGSSPAGPRATEPTTPKQVPHPAPQPDPRPPANPPQSPPQQPPAQPPPASPTGGVVPPLPVELPTVPVQAPVLPALPQVAQAVPPIPPVPTLP